MINVLDIASSTLNNVRWNNYNRNWNILFTFDICIKYLIYDFNFPLLFFLLIISYYIVNCLKVLSLNLIDNCNLEKLYIQIIVNACFI